MADQRPIGFWISLLDRMLDARFASTIDEHGVTRSQWQLLSVLARGAATVEQLEVALAPLAHPESESAVDQLTELIESGWVDATPESYELTERGRAAFDRLSAVINAQQAILVEGVSSDDQVTTAASLERMARNLGWGELGEPPTTAR